MKSGRLVAAVLVVALAACATAISGAHPEDKTALAMRITDNMTPEQVAALLKQHMVEVAILSSTHDSAWYAQVASAALMKMSRAGHAGNETFAFLGPQALGDTTLSLKVTGGGDVRLHDALYRINKTRRLDVMAVRIGPDADLRASVQALLKYVATDVLANASVIFAIEPPTPQLGDSVSVLMRAAFSDAWECTKEGHDGAPNKNLPIRLFYGPARRMRCQTAEVLSDGGGAVLGHLVMTY